MRTEANSDTDPLLHQLVADRFRLVSRIGHGSMGAVYRAEHVLLGNAVAVKLLSRARMRDAAQVERFRREAVALARVKDEHCVTVLDVGEAFGTLFIAMEFIDGVTLAEEQRITGPFDVNRALKVLRQVLQGLAAVHDVGIIHRDVKPQNLMLSQKAVERDLVKLVDFGIAKILDVDGDRPLTVPGTLFGTPEYMSPEQALGEPLDARADVYSAGVVAYQLILGQNPFRGVDARDTLSRVQQLPPPSIHDARPDVVVPDALEACLRRLVAKDRKERFASALDASRAVAALPPVVGRRAPVTIPPRAADGVPPVPLTASTPAVAFASPPSPGVTDAWLNAPPVTVTAPPEVLGPRRWASYVVGFLVLMGLSTCGTLYLLRPTLREAPRAPVPLAAPAPAPVPVLPVAVTTPAPPAPVVDTRRARAELRRGLRLVDEGRDTEAIAALTEAVNADDSLAEAHLKLGVLHYRQSRYRDARHHYRRYLELRPNADDAEQIELVLEALRTAP